METKFNFKSQICTSKVQSERLLALGLKTETADMVLLKEMVYDENNHCTRDGDNYLIRPIDYLEGEEHRGHIPAWSLHRLIEMMPNVIGTQGWLSIGHQGLHYSRGYGVADGGLYESIVRMYDWLIKEGYFNKEYLV